jgi:hypothetical protein
MIWPTVHVTALQSQPLLKRAPVKTELGYIVAPGKAPHRLLHTLNTTDYGIALPNKPLTYVQRLLSSSKTFGLEDTLLLEGITLWWEQLSI